MGIGSQAARRNPAAPLRPCRTRFRFTPRTANKSKGHPIQLGGLYFYWWSRRESNPRPQVLYR